MTSKSPLLARIHRRERRRAYRRPELFVHMKLCGGVAATDSTRADMAEDVYQAYYQQSRIER